MKVAIGLPHLSSEGKPEFVNSLIGLITHSLRNGIDIVRIATYRDNITFARNKIATKAIENKCDYLLFLDDDMVFEKDLLIKLLEHKKDVVGGLAFLRNEPHEPSMFKLNNDNVTYDPIFQWHTGALVECDAIGMAATLINTDVLEALKPISQAHNKIWGFYDNIGFLGEDLRFCFKTRQIGCEIFCDTSQVVGHIVEKNIAYGDHKAFVNQKVFAITKHQAIKKYKGELKNAKK